MATHVLKNGQRASSIAKFYLNKRVDVVLRVKALAKRLRICSKLHNEVNYGYGKNIELSRKKLENDPVDYIKVSSIILEELIVKSSFLSSSDCIVIFGLLSRIKSPLLRIGSGVINQEENTPGDSITTTSSKESDEEISKVIWKTQIVFLKLIMGFEKKQSLTNKERYYFICSLSRECSIINYDTWFQLFKNVREVLITKGSDSVFRYKPYEIANLILVYAQISRWAKKRQNNSGKHDSKSKPDESSELQEVNSDISKHMLKANENDDPFNLNFISLGISKLLPNLGEIKNDKIIKLLYLLTSKGMYNSVFFQSAYIHLASSGTLENMKVSDLMTIFKIYSRVCISKLLGSIEMFHYTFSIPYLDTLSSENIKMLNLSIPEIPDLKNTFLKNSKSLISTGNTEELDIALEITESLCLITLNILIEHILKISKKEIRSVMKDFSLDGITELYDEGWKWIDIIKISKRYSDLGDTNSAAESDYTDHQLESLIRNMSHLAFLTKALSQSLALCSYKYGRCLKRIRFFHEKLRTLLIIMTKGSKDISENRPTLEDAIIKLIDTT